MTTEYIAKIKGDTSSLENALKKAQGHLERLNDNEVVLKLNYDSNEQELNSIIKKIIDKNPEITVDIQYQLNKAALEHEMAKLSDMEMTADTSKLTNKLQELHKQYTQIFTSASNEELDAIEHEMAQLYSTILNCASGFEALEKLPKDLQEQLEDLEDVEPLKVFSESEIKKQRTIVQKFQDKIKELSSQLKSVDDQTKNDDGFSNIAKEANDTKSSLEELVRQFGEYSKAHDYNKVSSFWEEYRRSIEEGNQEAKELLKTLNLIGDKTGDIKLVNSGMVKSGGIIGDNSVLLATKNRELSNGSDRLTETIKLKDKLNEAADAGINVARILDIVADSEKKVFLELQEKAFGNNIGDYENSWVNPEIYDATDAQIQKLIQDFKLLNELGIGVDANVSNILYDKEKGFSFIDLDLNPAQYKDDADALDDLLGGITGTIRDFYEELGDSSGVAKIDSFENRIHDIVQSTSQGVSAVKESIKSIQQTDLDNGQVVDVAELEKAQGRIEELQDSVDSLSKSLGNSVDSWQYDAVRDTLFDAEGQIDHLNSKLKEQQEIMSNVQKFYSSYGTPTEALDANYFANIGEVLDVLGGKFKELDQSAEDFCEQKVNALFLKDLVDQLDLAENELTVVKAAFQDINTLLPGGKFAHLSDEFSNAKQIQIQLERIREIADGTHIVTDEEVENAREILKYAQQTENVTDISAASSDMTTFAIKQGEYYAKGIATGENLEKAGQAASLLSASALEALREDDANFHLAGDIQAHNYVDGINTGLKNANVDGDNINRQIIGMMSPEDWAKLEDLQPLQKQLADIVQLVTDKNRLFTEEAEIVESLTPREVNNLDAIYGTLTYIKEEIEAIQRAFNGLSFNADVNTDWIASISKLKNVDFKKISDGLSAMYKAVSKLNIKDSNILSSIQDLLNKGKELENLAKIISASNKDIKASKAAMVSQKDKDTKASYDKELSLLKEKLDLEHKIRVANAKGDGSESEVRAKNQPMIQMLEKQIALEGQRRKKARQTSQEYRNLINAEKKAIVDRYKAEEEGIRQVAIEKQAKQRQSDQISTVESQIKELNSLRDKLDSLLGQDKKYMSPYLDEVSNQMSALDEQIKSLEQAKIDIVNSKDVAELEQVTNSTKEIIENTNKVRAGASDTANKVAKAVKISSLKSDIAAYLEKNTKLSREFKNELNGLIVLLNSGKLSGEELADIVTHFNDIKTAARQAGQEGQNFFDKLNNRLSDMNAKFLAQYFSWQDWIRYIRTAAQTVTELDTALTELRKVSDASTERLNQSFETSAQTAQELGSSISDVINMTADWARLGYDVDQAEELARVTTLFQTVGDNMSADNASSYLISTLQGFQMATDQAEDIVDAYNEVANNFAIDTAGIGEALQRSAASFNAANTDLSESIALVTATNEVLQNPESVGTLWKTLSARIRGATTELQELGEEEDEYTKTTSKLRDLVQGLTGFDIMQDENNFKDIYEIILGIGKEWDKLTDVERASLGEALAGKRNSNALYAVLGNLDTLQEAYQKAESSAGSAAKEQENYAQSVQYSIDRNKASLQELARDFLSSDLLKTLLELANSLLQTLDKIVEKIGPEGVLGIAGVIVALFKGNQIKSAFDWISGLGDVFSKLGSGASLASQAVETAEAVSEIGEAAEESFWFIDELADGGTAISTIEVAAEGASGEVATLGGGISALSGALIALAAVAVVVGAALAWDHFTTTVEEAEEAVNDAKSKVIDLQSEIDELSQIENRTDGQEKRLRLLQDELDYQTKILETRQKTLAVEKYGNKFSDQFDFDNAYTQYGIDKSNRYDVDDEGNFVAEGTSAKNNIALLQKYIDLSKDADLSEKERNKNAQYAEKQTEKLKEKYDNYLSEVIDYESKLDEINQDIDSGLISPDGDEESKAAYERAIEAQKAYALWIAQDKSIIAEIEKALGTYDYVQDDIKQLASKWETGSISSEYIANELIDHMDGFSEAEKAAFYNAIKDAKSWIEVLDILAHKQEEVNEKTSELNPNSFNKEAALAKYDIDPTAFEKYLEVFKELNPELAKNEDLCAEAAVAQYALDQAVEDLRSHLNDYVENLENLDETSIEYANSIQSLASDLSALTGIDFSITDAQTFMQDKANLDLLRDALDGDNAALDRLRANAARNIVVSVSAELGTDEFAAQYDELVSWIAANPDLGVLEAQSHLESSDFIKTCFLLIQQGKMTAEQLKQIFANLKWNISWDTTTMKVPRLSSSGGSYTGLPSNVVADMKKQGTASKYLNANYGVKYDIIDVPTNIRFERGGSATTPKVSAPTSSSGSNYRPEQKSGSGGGGGGGGSSKDPTEEAKKDEEELEDTYDEFFDYFERRLKVVSDAISLLDAHLENVVGSNAKNTLLDAQMRIYKMQQQEYADAQNMYQEMADRALAKIEDSNIVEKIKNGAVGIDEFIGKGNEEVVNAINDYTKWADKVADCKQQLAELKETIRQLELTRMKNILQDWQDVFDLRQDNAIDLIDKQISLIEESGNLVGKAFYEQQKRQTEGQISAMEQAKRELSAELNRGLANGSIEVGTDEWIEEVGLLQEVESNILDCKQAIEEYDNAILAIHTDTFERLIDKFDDLDDELSDIAAFFDDEKVGDKFGNWSEAGQAQAGLLAQQYELAQNKVKKYAEQIDWLNGQYNAGKYSTTEYTEQLAELMDAMRESAKDAESAKEAMLDLNKARVDIVIDGINEEIEAYSDLISKEKDALSAEKDLHDYRKQIAESNKSIVAIQKQLAAIENDNSQKARAQRAKLQQQLKDAQDALAEQEYDHSVEMQQQALDEQLEQYKDTRQKEIDELNAYVENSQQVLSDMFEHVRANAESIGQTIVQTAQEHGFQVSTSLTESWKAGENAIASYGAVLTPATSEFIAQLENVEQQTWDLQDQADKTAVSLADMFGTRADTLVSELQRSWQAEANAQAMADALRQSMVYALESGYDISSVVSSLNSVANAAKDVAEAANDAAGALDNAISKQNAFNNMPKSSDLTHYTTIYNNPNANQVNWDYIGGHTSLNSSKSSNSYSTTIPGLGKKTKKHARGLTKAEQDELAWTQELGSEFIVSPTRNSILTPIKAGDAVIDAKGTRNLFELAKIDPNDILQGSGAKVVAPQIESTNNSVSIGNLVNVEGSISSENLDAVKATIQSELKKTFRNINSGLRR